MMAHDRLGQFEKNWLGRVRCPADGPTQLVDCSATSEEPGTGFLRDLGAAARSPEIHFEWPVVKFCQASRNRTN
eukprot:CAMPEP_0194493830 /NCGR_PEP_ID=MMETSP0253-20130528/11928_1 /TAXON_ID=2966 /ORGANISM="Noctiluca scintillans" /LENGTH=73 /DNA_ID=CAMNT_0039334863 /DNA_START=23 /DNA_END=241 /DNA_ORIENTATION=-